MIFSYLLHNTSFEFLFRFPGYSFWRSCDLGRLLESNTSLGPLGLITGLSGLGRLFSLCTVLALLFPRLLLKWLPQPAKISRTCSYFETSLADSWLDFITSRFLGVQQQHDWKMYSEHQSKPNLPSDSEFILVPTARPRPLVRFPRRECWGRSTSNLHPPRKDEPTSIVQRGLQNATFRSKPVYKVLSYVRGVMNNQLLIWPWRDFISECEGTLTRLYVIMRIIKYSRPCPDFEGRMLASITQVSDLPAERTALYPPINSSPKSHTAHPNNLLVHRIGIVTIQTLRFPTADLPAIMSIPCVDKQPLVFLGSSSHIGLVPCDAKAGDIVYHFWEANSAALLRQEPELKGVYWVVGRVQSYMLSSGGSLRNMASLWSFPYPHSVKSVFLRMDVKTLSFSVF